MKFGSGGQSLFSGASFCVNTGYRMIFGGGTRLNVEPSEY